MSETVKLIIEISKTTYEVCKKYKLCTSIAIANGTLLDDVKAEIEKCKEVANVPYDRDYLTTVWAYDDAIRVLDRIGKGDKEC